MNNRETELTSIALARQALNVLDDNGNGSSLFACKLAEALDHAEADRVGDQVLTQDVSAGASGSALFRVDAHSRELVASDGSRLVINPEAIVQVRGVEATTTVSLVDGSEVRISGDLAQVAPALGLPSVALSQSVDYVSASTARHQLRNLLAIVSAITNQVLDEDRPLIDKARDLAARTAMLSSIGDLLLQPQAHPTDLQALVSRIMNDVADKRCKVTGPSVLVGPGTAVTLGLALHELQVHSFKTGALSSRNGCVEISWSANDVEAPYLWLQWADRDGPRMRPPLSDWSNRLLCVATPRRLGGQCGIEELPSGLVWSLHAPLERLGT
jgi:two-component sensor histidine kinase